MIQNVDEEPEVERQEKIKKIKETATIIIRRK